MSDNKTPDSPAAFSDTAELDIPNANQRVDVTAEDLPLHCPMPGKRLWDSHPKVYLPIEDCGHALCPYCGTAYIFKGLVHSH